MSDLLLNHRTQRTPRVRLACILHQRRGAAGVDRCEERHSSAIRPRL
jgi:hypothetical protein